MRRSGKGTTSSHNSLSGDSSNSVSSNRPPRKAWEWYYRSFLSRSPSSSNHQHAQPVNDASAYKSPPRNIKQRLRNLGSKLHRRSATVTGNDLNSSTESKIEGGGTSKDDKISSSWTDACSKPLSQPVSMWDSPVPVFPSPSSTVDPYPEEWGHFSPPKHHYAAAPSYYDPRLHANIRKVGYCGSSSSLTMIDESFNDSPPYSAEVFPTNSVLFEDETLNQKNKQEQKISNLSLQMKKYLSTRSASTHQLSHQSDHAAVLGADMDSSRRSGSSRGSGAISRAVSAHCLPTNHSSIGTAQRVNLHDSKSRKLAFTKFHNSAQFGKDSVSAFLGDDTSIHYIALSDPVLTDTNTKSTKSTITSSTTSNNKAMGAESKPHTAASSLPDEVYVEDLTRLHPTSSTQKLFDHASSYPAHASVLNALPHHSDDLPANLMRRYTEDGKNCPRMIGPMVLMVCSSQYLPPLLPCMSHSKPNSLPMGMISLGFAKVSRAPTIKVTTTKDAEPHISHYSIQDHHESHFVLYHNYLLEYCCSDDTNDTIWFRRPIGYACLVNASVRIVDVAKIKTPKSDKITQPVVDKPLDVLEITFDGPLPTVQTQIKVLFHLESLEEIQRWSSSLSKASRISMEDLYSMRSIHLASDKNGSGEIGCGRYSTIYSAIKNPLNVSAHHSPEFMRRRALKIVSKDQFSYRVRRQKERADTLLREVTIQSILSRHISSTFTEPGDVPILQSLGMFETQTHLVLEMELLEGVDLFNYMSSSSQRATIDGGGLDEQEARYIARDIFEALLILKRIGIAHRDVKPANLLMCCADKNKSPLNKTKVKLCDFGMATFVGQDGLVRGRCGTPGFVAPEILLSGLQSGYPNKVDTFSAGVTLYVMLCGYEPFYGENEEQLILANKEGKIEFPESDWESASSHAKDLIIRLMEPNCRNRIEVDDVLQHPWFQDLEFPNSSDTVSQLSPPLSGQHGFKGCVVS